MTARTTRIARSTLDDLAEQLSIRRASLTHCLEALLNEETDALRSRDVSDHLDQESPASDCDVITQLILMERTEQRLREVDAALDRFTDGSYGRCDRCGADIPIRRLRALPTARVCVPCADRRAPRPEARSGGGTGGGTA